MSAKSSESVRRLGEYLVEAEALRSEQIGMLLDEQRENVSVGVQSRIGEIAVRKGWVDADQVTGALKSQAQAEIDRTDAGQVLLALGWISAAQLDEARRRCARSSEPLEEAIAELKRCAGTQFDAAVVEAFLTARGAPEVDAAAAAQLAGEIRELATVKAGKRE